MYCRQCGKPVNDNQELCDDCQAKLNNQNLNSNEITNEEKKQAINTTFTQTNPDNNQSNINQSNTGTVNSKDYVTPDYNNNNQNPQYNNINNQANYGYNQNQQYNNMNTQANYRYNQNQQYNVNQNTNMQFNNQGYNGYYNGMQGNPNAKSKLAAGILGILLGVLGVHNFYLGYIGKAVAQLLLTLLSCGFLSFIPFIWGIIEGILLLTGNITTDGQGNPLRD